MNPTFTFRIEHHENNAQNAPPAQITVALPARIAAMFEALAEAGLLEGFREELLQRQHNALPHRVIGLAPIPGTEAVPVPGADRGEDAGG